MNRKTLLKIGTQRRAATGIGLGLLALLILLAPPEAFQQTNVAQASVFELELPEFGIAPTVQPEIEIPSPATGTIVLNILNPQADQIDYGQIVTHVNGQSTALLSEIGTGPRGKIVRINLRRYPGYELVVGRNTVEILARNKRGREFYTSFVLRTATENRNQDFAYNVVQGADARQKVPPELVLFEPAREIVLPAGARSQRVRVAGVATAATSVVQVTIDGAPATLKRGEQVALRGLKLVNSQNRVSFETVISLDGEATEVVVEAKDAGGNRTQLKVPVRRREKGAQGVFSGRKYALIIGISKFGNNAGGVSDLNYADSDALALHKFLQTPSGGRFSPDNMLLLVNEQATLARLQQAMRGFVSQAGPDDLILVFLATHGDADPFAKQNLYFITHDTNVDRMPETAFAMKDFKRMLDNNVRARRMLLLIDTCHSAGLTGSGGETSRGLNTNNLVNQYAEKLLYGEEGKAVITSSGVNEESQESPRWGGGHGVFTYYLLEGMRGMADLDLDRVVTVRELFQYVRQRVYDDTSGLQTPHKLPGANDDLALALIPTTGAD